MSDKLIKASDAVDIVAKHSALYGDGEISTDDGEALLYEIMSEITNLPSAEPEWKTGKWIIYIPEHGKCSCCGNQVDLIDGREHNFCEVCGARMEGVSDEQQ